MRQRRRREAPAGPTGAHGALLVTDRVRTLCEQIVERRGLELVELLLGREGRRQVLRITVDDPGGPTSLEDVSRVSEEISRALDAEDPIPGRYTLEVSSAGLERPLVRPSDYVRFNGRVIRVRTHEPIEGHRTFRGPIRSAGEDTFVIEAESDGGSMPVEVPYIAVARAKLVVDWENELRRRPARQGPAPIGAAGQQGREGGEQ